MISSGKELWGYVCPIVTIVSRVLRLLQILTLGCQMRNKAFALSTFSSKVQYFKQNKNGLYNSHTRPVLSYPLTTLT